MKVFYIILGLFQAFLLKVFPSLGFEGVINTQIKTYNKIKRMAPQMTEDDVLNNLIISRVESLPRVATKEKEYFHYKLLLENPDKTLEDVILAIVEYEYFISREEQVLNRLHKMGLPQSEINAARDNLMEKPKRYLKRVLKRKPKIS